MPHSPSIDTSNPISEAGQGNQREEFKRDSPTSGTTLTAAPHGRTVAENWLAENWLTPDLSVATVTRGERHQ